MTVVLAFEEEVVRVICGYGLQSGRGIAEKEQFFNEMVNEWDLQQVDELVLGISDFNGHVGKRIQRFEGVHGGNGIGKRNLEGRMLLEFCDEKELYVVNMRFRKTEKRKVTFNAGGNETEIDFMLVGRENRKYLRDVKAIPGELQHRLVVADLDKRKVKKHVKREQLRGERCGN
uniref:Endonuclease/exonuclease/phosphatase domain-containing protein n=1 Tax=Octopus bimaculoides TaxID=37653 RepID=A0A0L8HA70_OCTBM